MPAIETMARMGENDIAAVAALLAAAQAADGHAPLGEHKWLDLVQGGRAGFAGFVAREAGHDHPVGYAQLSRGESSWAIEFVVHPAHRADSEEIGVDLLEAAIAEIARRGGGHLHLWVPKPTPIHDEIARRVGFRRGRELLQLRRPLAPHEHFPDSEQVVTRPFDPAHDEQAWLEVNAKAFAGHPEQGGWDLETLRDREHQPWFDPAGFLLYGEDGRIDAFCWTKVHDDERLGEIFVIGVDPSAQGRGLGRKLLAAGLEHLAAAGLPTAMLYVDADNTAAVGLYRAFDFSENHHDLAYVMDVEGSP